MKVDDPLDVSHCLSDLNIDGRVSVQETFPLLTVLEALNENVPVNT